MYWLVGLLPAPVRTAVTASTGRPAVFHVHAKIVEPPLETRNRVNVGSVRLIQERRQFGAGPGELFGSLFQLPHLGGQFGGPLLLCGFLNGQPLAVLVLRFDQE